jgi:parvulin-like peptidyl-prolyl isomerase
MAGKDASSAPVRKLNRSVRVPGSEIFFRLTVVCLIVGLLGVPLALAQSRPPAALPAATAGPQPAPAASKPATPIMAVVNGEQILRENLANECLRRYGQEVLENLINREIISQACQARNVVITEQDVDTEVRNVAERFGLTADRWLSVLQSERNVDPVQYRRDIIWPTLALRRLASTQVTVTDVEFRQAFESEYGPKIRARVIAVSSREKADRLRQMAQNDPDSFPQLAKEHSEDRATASVYGVIPPIRKHVGDAEIEQIAYSLKEGEISPVITVGNQYLILKCEQHIARTFVSAENMPAIEQQLREQVLEHKMRMESANLFQDLLSRAQIVKILGDAELEKRHPGTAAMINGRQFTIAQLAEQCLTRHGQEVLDGEINRRLLQQELRRRNQTVEERDIDHEVARAADAYGYLRPDGQPDIEAWLNDVTEGDRASIDLYIRDAVWPSVALKKLVDGRVQVTQDDMQKGFESNYGERVEVLAMVIGNHRQAQSVWEMARNNPTEQFFGELAHQYSIEPTSRANYGKVPPIRKHGGQPLVEQEAFKLKPGELSGIIAIGDQFVILRCLGRTQPVVTDINLVKNELYKDLHEKKLRIAMATEFDRLRESAQIDNFLAGTSQTGTRPRGTASQAGFVQPAASQTPAVRR